MKSKFKLNVLKGLAVILAIVLVGTGVYLWGEFSSIVDARKKKFENAANLVDTAPEIINLASVTGDITKQIFVENADSTTTIYVRVQLKEYLEMAYVEPVRSEYRYAVNSDGNFVVFDYPDTAQGRALAVNDATGTPYAGYPLDYKTDAVEKKSGWYVRSGASQVNGVYGVFIVEDEGVSEVESIIPDVTKADPEIDENNDGIPDGDCYYTVHSWNKTDGLDCELGFHDYIKWVLGDSVISFTEWQRNGGEKGAQWVYDDTKPSGWIYWLKEIEPGDKTLNLMESLQLTMRLDGKFYYAQHADVDCTDNPNDWLGDAPSAVISVLNS